jgi:hypothetical protein
VLQIKTNKNHIQSNARTYGKSSGNEFDNVAGMPVGDQRRRESQQTEERETTHGKKLIIKMDID